MNSSKRGKKPQKQTKGKSIARTMTTQAIPARALPSVQSRSVKAPPFTYGTPSDPKTERVLTILGNISGTQYLNAPAVNGDGSPASSTTSFFQPLNPGNRLLFSQLANTAVNFNRYRFTHLKFNYLENASGYATGNQTGNVLVAYNPDAMDPFQDNTIALTALHHVQGSSWVKKSITIPKEKLGGWRFVDSGGLIPGSDVHSYYVGTLIGGSFLQNTSSVAVGFLESEYAVELDEPINRQLVLGANTAAPTYQSLGLRQVTMQTGLTSGSTYFLDGNNWSLSNKLNLAGFTKPVSSSVNLVTIPEGNWMFHGNISLLASGANDYFNRITITAQVAGNSEECIYEFTASGAGASYQSGPREISVPLLYHINIAPNLAVDGSAAVSFRVTCTTIGATTWSIQGTADGSSTQSRSYACFMPMA